MRFRKDSRSTTVAPLATLPMFADCRERDLRLIDRAGTRVNLDAGRVLCREGELGKECFVVLSGHAHVTIDGCRVRTVGRGALIGEIALLSPSKRRAATVTAQTPMSLLVIGRREFRDLVRTTPGIPERLVYDISERLTDNLARIRSDRGLSSQTFAGGRHWADDVRPIRSQLVTS